MINRRSALAFAAVWFTTRVAAQQEPHAFPLRADDGSPVVNSKLPSGLDPTKLPGIVWKGPADAKVSLIEYFDYNCGYCREAVGDLDALAASEPSMRLGLVDYAVLSPELAEAAKVHQAVLALAGPERGLRLPRAPVQASRTCEWRRGARRRAGTRTRPREGQGSGEQPRRHRGAGEAGAFGAAASP